MTPPAPLFPVTDFPDDFRAVWGDDAYALGRPTDVECRAPHDPYRVVYKTFFGMRDVLGPLLCAPRTAVLPFGYEKLPGDERVVVEALPAATLYRLGLPRWNYKRPGAARGYRAADHAALSADPRYRRDDLRFA